MFLEKSIDLFGLICVAIVQAGVWLWSGDVVQWREGRLGTGSSPLLWSMTAKGFRLWRSFFTLPLFQVREQAKNQNGHVDGQRKNFVHRHLAYLPDPVFQPRLVRVREIGSGGLQGRKIAICWAILASLGWAPAKPEPGAECFHWVQYTMIYLYSKVRVEKAALGWALPVSHPILPAVYARNLPPPQENRRFSQSLWQFFHKNPTRKLDKPPECAIMCRS